jgi:hypothetical protein
MIEEPQGAKLVVQLEVESLTPISIRALNACDDYL